MQEKTDLIVHRRYQKGDQFVALIVREVSGGDISGSMYQCETWKNNEQDMSLRETSGDMFFIRRRFITKLLDLLDEGGWKKTNSGVCVHQHSVDFDPAQW